MGRVHTVPIRAGVTDLFTLADFAVHHIPGDPVGRLVASFDPDNPVAAADFGALPQPALFRVSLSEFGRYRAMSFALNLIMVFFLSFLIVLVLLT